MNTKNARGYDDTLHLEQMAKGIIEGRYSSVTEAAKKVLGEDAGSNVDRLRRKFRDDGSFQRGREGYVEKATMSNHEETEVEKVSFFVGLFEIVKALSRFYRSPLLYLKGIFFTTYMHSLFIRMLTFGWIIGLINVGSRVHKEGFNLDAIAGVSLVFLFTHLFFGLGLMLYDIYKDEKPDVVLTW